MGRAVNAYERPANGRRKSYPNVGACHRIGTSAPHTCSSIEIFARDIAQWSFDGLPPATDEWSQVATSLRFDWTDAEAKAAGWRPAINAFSW